MTRITMYFPEKLLPACLLMASITAHANPLASSYDIQTIGLTDADHTRLDGHRSSSAGYLNNAGLAAGTSQRYNGTNNFLGQSAWLYNGTTTQRLNYVDLEHTRNDGFQLSSINGLNDLGYGFSSHLPLSFVYNPSGPFLPPSQTVLEADYKRELFNRFGITFTRLLTITNMPIGRFWEELQREHKADEYAALLKNSFNPQTIDNLMCCHQISIGWDGTLYDCDFNLALDLPVNNSSSANNI